MLVPTDLIDMGFTSFYLCVSCRDDLARALKKLHVMGSGFQVIPIGNKRLVQSVPGELSMDHAAALQSAQVCTKGTRPLATKHRNETTTNLKNATARILHLSRTVACVQSGRRGGGGRGSLYTGCKDGDSVSDWPGHLWLAITM